MYIQGVEEITIKELSDRKIYDQVISCINKYYNESKSFMTKKHADRKRLDNQEVNNIKDGKIKSQDMLTARKMYNANFLQEGLYPEFEGVNYGDEMLANDISKIAKNDQEKMRLPVRFKQLTDHIFNYGAGIIVEDYIDHVNKTVVPKIYNPLSYLPDPHGNYIDNTFRYHFFSAITTKGELEAQNDVAEENIYFDLDKVVGGATYDEQSKRYRELAIRGFTPIEYSDEIYITHAFIEINGIKYRATLSNANQLIIRWEKLDAITKAEKKDSSVIPYPVSIVCPYPIENDIFGVSPRELMFDFARAINKIVNSVYRKELRNAGSDIYFVDSEVNLASLANKDDTGPIFVPYTKMGEVQQPMVKGSEFADTRGSLVFYEWLKNRGQENTGITDIKLGNPDQNDTLGQMNQQLRQSDIMFGLDVDMIAEGMKHFWKNIWFRNLRQHIKERGDKYVAITGYLGKASLIKITNSDLSKIDDPNITVVSKRRKMRDARRKLQHLQAFYPLEQADQTVPPIVKKLYKRDMYRLGGFEEDEIHAYVPLDGSEKHSIDMMNIINEGIKPRQLIIPGLDLQTLWVYINMCNDNDVKESVLQKLNIIMIEEGMQQPAMPEQDGSLQGIQNSMGAQMLSKNLADNVIEDEI